MFVPFKISSINEIIGFCSLLSLLILLSAQKTISLVFFFIAVSAHLFVLRFLYDKKIRKR
ncbi:hypothetical protein HMPREF9372_0064 [Sporosarcina newyorkensis 2681]|uniref:Uncharacterized protein n=1 Tax=Sporosarcina newyorkensis 2681 TaxID=1027292 RepID=F9DMN4_9BACL|nr:hypothetical protein HMPREF9372_0064 [Sporosarcina newyorkensis 2681]